MREVASFDELFEWIGNDDLYIYGLNGCAQTLYMYMILHGRGSQIKGYLVSDLNSVTKKDLVMHKNTISTPHDVMTQSEITVVLCAYNDSAKHAMEDTLLAESPNAKVYSVNKVYAKALLEKYICDSTLYILKNHHVVESSYEIPFWNVSDKGSVDYYKYHLKLNAGSFPDTRIYGEDVKLDNLHKEQIGSYVFVEDGKKEKPDSKFTIYMAQSHVDKALAESYESLYTKPIQVGAALTDIRFGSLTDDVGENLSVRNRDYCELSAQYWAWKNDHSSNYIGLCHYRRRFVLSEAQFAFIEENNLDAVFTIPKIIDQGVEYEFVNRCNHVKREVWEYLDKAIREVSPEYLEAWEQLKKASFLITLNMSIMRREVFEDYSKWLFGVLAAVDKNYTDRGIIPNNRYLGYLGECLTTVYAIKNKASMRWAYTEVKFLKPAE